MRRQLSYISVIARPRSGRGNLIVRALRLLSFTRNDILCLVILFFLTGVAFGKYSGGTGEPNSPYLISSPNDLNSIGLDANDWDKHFKMTADINMADITGEQFNIIGSLSDHFTGVFDGNGHTISYFTYNTTSGEPVALFSYADTPCVIKNLTLYEPDVTGQDFVAAVVGKFRDGTVSNTHVISGNISGFSLVAGLIGWSDSGQITECSSGADVNNNNGDFAGGLVALNQADISRSFASGNVSGFTGIGGLVGLNNKAQISGCYAAGYVNGHNEIGGLVGSAGEYSTVLKCCSKGIVSGEDYVGGLIGHSSNGSLYTKCFWDSDVCPDVNGIGNGSDPNVLGLPTVLMQTKSTFTDAGWDFAGETVNGPNDIWDICEGTNYPRFVWQILPADLMCPDGVDFIDYSYLADRWWLEELKQDYDSDGRVNFIDWALLVDDWDGSYAEPAAFVNLWLARSVGRADISPAGGDDFVDWRDFVALVENWLRE